MKDENGWTWPHRFLRSVPDETIARKIAEQVTKGASRYRDGRLDISILCDRARARVSAEDLKDRAQAYLMPCAGNRFEIQIDPARCGCEPQEVFLVDRARLVVGHEIGHTFFYDRIAGAVPRRRTMTRWLFTDPDEERWCDRFAEILLGLEHAPPWPVRKSEQEPE